jgi:hypothetical protein
MVLQILWLNLLIYALTGCRAVLHQLMLIQRLPFLVVFTVFLVGVRFGPVRWHRFFLMGFRWVLRCSFYVRGIRVAMVGNSNLTVVQGGVNVCNAISIGPWLLMAVLPYTHIMICQDAFFKNFRPLLFLLGFYPQEYGVTPTNYQAFESRLTPYFNENYSIWQPVFFEYRDLNPLPYAVIMAIKHGRSVNVWKLHSADGLEFSHWLNRRVVRLELVSQVAMSRRMALTISAYNHTVNQYFGAPLTQTMSTIRSGSGTRRTNSDLAKETIQAAKQRSDEWESSTRSP